MARNDTRDNRGRSAHGAGDRPNNHNSNQRPNEPGAPRDEFMSPVQMARKAAARRTEARFRRERELGVRDLRRDWRRAADLLDVVDADYLSLPPSEKALEELTARLVAESLASGGAL